MWFELKPVSLFFTKEAHATILHESKENIVSGYQPDTPEMFRRTWDVIQK